MQGAVGGGNSFSERARGSPLGGLRLAAVIALLAVMVVALGIDIGSGGGTGLGWTGVLGEFELRQRSNTFSHSAYWLGLRPGFDNYQLEVLPNGDIYVRYLNDSDELASKSSLLTVGTYPVPEAATALSRAARESGGRVLRHPGFETLVEPRANNSYLVLEGDPELQIEIYSPQPGEAARLAESGAFLRLH